MRSDVVPGSTFPDYELQEFRNSVGAQWPFLSDPERIRPDWDLGAPGLRDAWNAGDFSSFHGWDKQSGAVPSPV